jgi:hypothetical protein
MGGCRQYCKRDATFSARAEPLAATKRLGTFRQAVVSLSWTALLVNVRAPDPLVRENTCRLQHCFMKSAMGLLI